MLTLDVLKAKYGDCLLLHVAGDNPAYILIDGGPSATFDQSLKLRLEELSLQAFSGNPAKIDLAMISHIDSDHIGGMVKLLEYEQEAKLGEHSSLANIRRLWHNSFFDLGGDAIHGTSGTRESAVATASTALDQFNSIANNPQSDFGVVMAGVAQGNRVSELARFHRIKVNPGFTDGLVIAGESIDNVTAATLHVLGPEQDEINDLREKWVAYMEKLREQAADVQTAAATLDTTVANLSSIVVMVEHGDRRILLTGDARGDYVLKSLENGGWINDSVCRVDVFKWPHHGSIKNFPEGVFSTIVADHHVISADGRHDNPDIETIERFIAEHDREQRTTLHMTYATSELRDDTHGEALNVLLTAAVADGHRISVNTPSSSSKPWLTINIP